MLSRKMLFTLKYFQKINLPKMGSSITLRLTNGKIAVLLFCTALFIVTVVFPNIFGPLLEMLLKSNAVIHQSSSIVSRYEMVIATVACGDRHEEVITMIKSALIFSAGIDLSFIIFVDKSSEAIVQALVEKVKVDSDFTFTYEIRQSWFPPAEESRWRSMFAPCSTQRLFFPSLLPEVDSLLYVDSDTLFLSSLKYLWGLLDHMRDGSYIAGMAPEHESSGDGWYNLHAKMPYYGARGLNAGVMLMNLTRMRRMDFEKSIKIILEDYGGMINWADQDLLNVYFHFFPELLLEFGCDFNFRAQHCSCQFKGICSCEQAKRDGAHVIHGNRRMFHSDIYVTFRNIYRTFRDFKLHNVTARALLKSLEESISTVPATSPCGNKEEHTHLFDNIRRYIIHN